MPSRFEVLRSYALRLQHHNVNTLSIQQASVKSTSEHIPYVLDCMKACHLFRRETLDHNTIWNIYAQKQKDYYLRHFEVQSPNNEEITRCYICANLVGKDKHSWFPPGKFDHLTPQHGIHHWNISHIISNSDSECGENFNLRICCRECNVRTGTSTPLHCAPRLRKEQSLAIIEGVETMEKAFNAYFQYYSGAQYEIIC